uniref:Uncharacterized protein n=1 Tax=Leersia perrieri TaxID=77586 RepID=A0A0D9XDT3_9ORYZ
MFIGSQMVIIAASASREAPRDGDAAATALLRELMEHEVAVELGLAGDDVDSISADICSPACQTCMNACLIKCLSKPYCFEDCIITDECFTLITAVTV